MRHTVAAAVLLAVLAGCGGAKHASGPPRLVFADSAAPLGYTEQGLVARHGSVRVVAVSYVSLGEVLPAYLVEGPARPNRPGVVVVHGSGSDRNELLARAIALARLGAVALAITEPSSAYPLPQPTTLPHLLSESRTAQVQDVVAVRRGADVLATLPDVRRGRVGYLGWSAGAKTGTFVAASDPRFVALALLSAGADPVAAFAAQVPAADRAAVRNGLGSIDPIRYLGFARAGSVLLEDGTRDTVVPHAALENIVRAAPTGTSTRWFHAGHALNDAAYNAAYRFLLRRI
jgi:dienelactone hydrolase